MTTITVTRKISIVSNAAPAWVPGTPFASRALSGAYAPSNGNTTFYDAMPSQWKVPVGIASYPAANVTEYSGGFSDPANRLLFAHGGGHGDSNYNGILKFDLNGVSAPTGWTVVTGSQSDVANVPLTEANHETYLDGKAGSIHSYDNMHFDATGNRLHRFQGSYWRQGTGSKDWAFNFSSGQWEALPVRAFSFNGADLVTIHDPSSRKALVLRANTARFYDSSTQTWGLTNKAAPDLGGYHYHGAFDPTRNRALFLGGNLQVKKYATVDFSAETVSTWADFSASGDTAVLADEGYATFYDPLLDRFWLFGGRNVPFDKLYWIDAADFADGAVTVYSQSILGDGAVPRQVSSPGAFFGLFKRFCFIPEWRAVAVATSYNQPVYIIKLPS